MIISLTDDCPIFRDECSKELSIIFQSISKGWNTLAAPEPARLRQLIPAAIWEIYGVLLTESFKSAANAPGGLAEPADCGACDCERLGRYFELPCILLLENATSDGKFIEQIIHHLKPSIKRHFAGSMPNVQIRHGGGINGVISEIERLSASYASARPAGTPSRFIAIVDSDSREPGTPSTDARHFRSVAERAHVNWHILRKRSIENYLPDDALTHYGYYRRERLGAVRAILGLDSTARDHYPMKTGLPEAEGVEADGLYPPSFPRMLGLGNFVSDMFQVSAHQVSKGGLLQRDHDNELMELLELIERNT